MLRKINNIYVPTETEYAELSKIVDNKETMYDYIVAKTFEYDLWSFYHTNRFEEVPIDMYDTFIFEKTKLVEGAELNGRLLFCGSCVQGSSAAFSKLCGKYTPSNASEH